MPKMTLKQQADEILANAEKKGVQTNFFFATTFKRYLDQMNYLTALGEQIDEMGMTVQKEYVKGRMNVYTNPCLNEYNKTASAANNTVQTLIKIIQAFAKDSGESSESALNEFMKRMDDLE